MSAIKQNISIRKYYKKNMSADSYLILKDIVEKITTQENDNGQLRMLTRQLSKQYKYIKASSLFM